jgi:thymidylate kinase
LNTEPLNLAARIVSPVEQMDLSAADRADVDRAAEVLVDQKVSLLGLRERYGSVVDEPPLGPYIEWDRAEYQRQRGEFEKIRTAFLQQDIPAMLFKSTGLFPSFHYLTSNLDVIVPEGRVRDARGRLLELGYVELLNVEEPKKYLFRRFPGDGTSYAFHLHTAVGWGVPFVDAGALWQNARPADDDPDIVIPGPGEAMLVTLAHWFYEDKELSLGNLLATAHALARLHRPLAEVAREAAGYGWEDGFWAALEVADKAWRNLYGVPLVGGGRREEMSEALSRHRSSVEALLSRVSYGGRVPAELPFFESKRIYYRKVLRDPSRPLWRRALDVVATLLWAVRWKLHIRSQHGLLISISGCDGSGKTLQAERLQRVFETCDVRVRGVWARGASSRFMGVFIRMGKKLGGGEGRGGGEDGVSENAGDRERLPEDRRMESRRRSLQNPLSRFAFGVLYALDLGWVYCVKTRWWLWAGNVVVADRYVYDGLVDFALFSGVAQPPLSLRWLRRLSPKPAVAAILDVDPEEALRRKPEEGGTGHIAEARNAFAALSRFGRFRIFPSDWTPEEINRELAMRSLEAFYERYGTFLNWLLWSNPRQMNRR